MALPTWQVAETPIGAAKAFVRAGRLGARGLSSVGWTGAAILIGAAAILILALSRNKDQDLVSVALDGVPFDDEVFEAGEEATVEKARTEASIPWEQVRERIRRPETTRH
jgi:hypothetical protein